VVCHAGSCLELGQAVGLAQLFSAPHLKIKAHNKTLIIVINFFA
jgi:hypothetical protein